MGSLDMMWKGRQESGDLRVIHENDALRRPARTHGRGFGARFDLLGAVRNPACAPGIPVGTLHNPSRTLGRAADSTGNGFFTPGRVADKPGN